MSTTTYEGSVNIDVKCANNCYSIIYIGEEERSAAIFIYGDFMGVASKDYENIIDIVCYWRKDERYLTKMMGI
jgi:hypothetical protein